MVNVKGSDLPYLIRDPDRHGNVRYYAQRPKCTKARIRDVPGTVTFKAAYAAALAKSLPRSAPTVVIEGSLRWLCQQYMTRCADYKAMDPQTRHVRKLILDKLCLTPAADGELYGAKIAKRATVDNIEEIRDANDDRPEAANGIVKALRQVFKWAKKKKLVISNPAMEVDYLDSGNPDGFHMWTDEEVEQFEAHHPIGSKPRLAMTLFLYLGPRRSDAVRIGPQMVRDGKVKFVEFKGRKKIRKERVLPILRPLADVIAGTPCGHLTYLTTEFGKPFSVAGLGNKFREWCDEAGLPRCSAHGLRKAGAQRAADNGATVYQLMAIYGWTSIKTAEIYTRRANQKKLAASGMPYLLGESPTFGLGESPTLKKA